MARFLEPEVEFPIEDAESQPLALEHRLCARLENASPIARQFEKNHRNLWDEADIIKIFS